MASHRCLACVGLVALYCVKCLEVRWHIYLKCNYLKEEDDEGDAGEGVVVHRLQVHPVRQRLCVCRGAFL